jgi:hypothetical protein
MPEMEGTPPPRHAGDGGAAAAGMAGVRGERTGATEILAILTTKATDFSKMTIIHWVSLK